MTRPHHDDIERDEVSREDLEAALKQVLPAGTDNRPRSQDREPTREEMNRR